MAAVAVMRQSKRSIIQSRWATRCDGERDLDRLKGINHCVSVVAMNAMDQRRLRRGNRIEQLVHLGIQRERVYQSRQAGHSVQAEILDFEGPKLTSVSVSGVLSTPIKSGE